MKFNQEQLSKLIRMCENEFIDIMKRIKLCQDNNIDDKILIRLRNDLALLSSIVKILEK